MPCSAAFGKLRRRFFEVMDMDSFSIDDCSTCHGATTNRSFFARCQLTIVRRQPHDVAVRTEDLGATRFAEVRRVLRDGLQNRREVSG